MELKLELDLIKMTLEWEGAGHQNVSVAGDFTKWQPIPLTKVGDNKWVTEVKLEPGCYAHKWVVDGEWKNKEGAELEVDNAGNVNSLLVVEEDYEEETSNNSEQMELVTDIKEIEAEPTTTEGDNIDNKLHIDNDKEDVDLMKEKAKEVEVVEKEIVVKDDAKDAAEKDIAKIEEELDTLTLDIPKTKAKKVSNRRKTIDVIRHDDNENAGSDILVKKPLVRKSKLHPDDVESPRRVTRGALTKLVNN